MEGLSPQQHAELIEYEKHEDRAAGEWLTYQGARWALRNPKDLDATDRSFLERYGYTKTWALRDAVRGVPREASCLEIGCSRGAFMQILEAVGFARVVGMDIALPALQEVGTGRVCQGDGRRLPFATRSVDLVATAGSLMHFGPKHRMTDSVFELARVTRRWLLMVELWSAEATLVSFGELLPPVWLYSWEQAIPNVLGPEHWAVR